MPQYLVGDPKERMEERDFVIVTANSQAEAIDRYLRNVTIHEDILAEYLCDKSFGGSFAAEFWFQTEEENHIYASTGDILIDEIEFERRVREFFGAHQDYADLYLDQYLHDDEHCDPTLFPEEMRFYVAARSNWIGVEAIPLHEIDAF